ncbi:MAG: NUDIX domain-containing protein [Oscillospiraceae bacterium]|nr:NUDIX domain-containing protein [Oscillospiraceae bacterium]
MTDITLQADDGYFNYRVGAVIIHENHVLMVKNENYPYYYSVGGRVHFGETSDSAVLREVYEETKLRFEIDGLAFIHENFFIGGFKDNKPFHEIAFFFLMKSHEHVTNIKCSSVGSDGGKESLYWLPIDKLNDYPVYPEFFKYALANPSEGTGHFVTKDDRTYRVK